MLGPGVVVGRYSREAEWAKRRGVGVNQQKMKGMLYTPGLAGKCKTSRPRATLGVRVEEDVGLTYRSRTQSARRGGQSGKVFFRTLS